MKWRKMNFELKILNHLMGNGYRENHFSYIFTYDTYTERLTSKYNKDFYVHFLEKKIKKDIKH